MARLRRQPDSAGPAPAQIVERAINQTNAGRLEHDLRRGRFDKAYEVWRGTLPGETRQTVAQRQVNRDQNQQSRLRVKYGMQVIDQALVNLVQGVPQAKVTARRPEAEPKAEAVQKLLSYYADLDHLAEREPVICQQALIYGLSPAKVHWLYCEKDGRVVDDRPTLEPWDAYSIWWDPLAPTVDECGYIVLESWKTREELEAGRYNEDDGTGTWRNLDLLYQLGDGPVRPATAQDRVVPQPPESYRGRFQLWEIWRKQPDGIRCTVVGNQKVLLKDGPSPYRMNSYPVTISNSRPDLFRIEGVSEAELVDHLQQAMWTVQNLRMENLKMTVMRMMSIRATVPDHDSIVLTPRARWLVNDHDDVMLHAAPPLPPEAYREDEALLSLLQYVTGITPYVGGASGTTSGVDQNTATGVSLLTESASRLLAFKARMIHERTWQRTFEMWGELCKQFVKRSVPVRIALPGGQAQWIDVGVSEVNDDFDIRIEAGEDAAIRSGQRADAIAFLNAMAPFVQMGLINPQPLIEKVAKAFDIPDPGSLAMPAPAAPPMAAPTGLNGNGGQPALLGTGLGGQQHLAAHPPMSILAGNQ